MSCVLMINDMFLIRVPIPLLLYPKGRGLQGRYRVSYYNNPDHDSIPNLPNLQKLCTYRAMLSWATCLGLLESSTGWAESLWAPPSTIQVHAVRYPWYRFSSAAPECLARE
jgi:hypothetical protein